MYFLFELHCNHFFILYLVIEKSSNTSFIFGLSKFVLTFTLIFGRITKHPPCPPRSWPTKLAWQHFATRICLCNNSYDNVGGGLINAPSPYPHIGPKRPYTIELKSYICSVNVLLSIRLIVDELRGLIRDWIHQRRELRRENGEMLKCKNAKIRNRKMEIKSIIK